MKSLFLMTTLTLLASCSGGGGGGGGKNPEPSYSIAYIYPENTLGPGQGAVDVMATGAICVDEKGDEVDPLNCEELADIDLSLAPTTTHLSPAGSAVVTIDNSNEETITVEFGEGESWASYDETQKRTATDGKVTCLTGFDYTFRGSCEIFAPEFRYGVWPENDMESCSGQRIVNRTFECFSNITGEIEDISQCSTLTPDDSMTQLSPVGVAEATLPNGDVVNLLCQEGHTVASVGSEDAVVQSSISCGADRHMDSGSCHDDTFIADSFIFEDLNLQAGDGVAMANAIGISSCIREHDGAPVDPSYCSMPETVPQQSVFSPAGIIEITLDNSDGPVTVTVGEGQTWADIPTAEKVNKLEGLVSCSAGFQLSYQAECVIPQYTAVLGDYPENLLAVCEGTQTVYPSYQCLYNITGALMDDSHCANTGTSLVHNSPAGTKEVTHANGDIVVLSCGEGVLEADATISSYTSCGENRFKDDGICIDDTFVPEFNFPDPMLEIGDGEVEVTATGILSCKRLSDDVAVDNSLCEMPTPAPTKLFLSPEGEINFTNSTFDTYLVGVGVGEVPSESSNFIRVLSCGRHRTTDNADYPCRNANIVGYGACSQLGFVFLNELGDAFSAGVTSAGNSEENATVRNFVSSKGISQVMCVSNMFFAYNPSTKQAVKWGSGTPVVYSNVEGIYKSRYATVISKSDNSLEIIHNPHGITAGVLPTVPHGDIKDVRCFRMRVASSTYRSGCVVLKNDGTLVASGNPADYLIRYSVERSTGVASGITSVNTEILSGTYDGITENYKGSSDGDDFGVVFHGIGSTDTKGIGATMVNDYGPTGGGPASVPAGIRNIKHIYTEHNSFTAVDEAGDHYFWGSRTDVLNLPSHGEKAVTSFFWDSLIFYEDGSIRTNKAGSGFAQATPLIFSEVNAVGNNQKYYGISDGNLHFFSQYNFETVPDIQGFFVEDGLYFYKDSTGKWTNPSLDVITTTIRSHLNPHLYPLAP